MDKKAFLFGEIRSVELQTCREIISRHETVAEMRDVKPLLSFKGDEDVVRYFYDLFAYHDEVYTLGDVPLNRVPENFRQNICPLKKNGVPGHLAVVLQVAALLGHRPTRYELSVANFAMNRFGAADADAELRYIALRDRLAQGFTMFDETEAARRIDEFPLKNAVEDFAGAFIYLFECGSDLSMRWRAAVLDELMLENRGRRFGACFFDSMSEVRCGKIVSAMRPENVMLLEMRLPGYSFFGQKRDERTGLYEVEFEFCDGVHPDNWPLDSEHFAKELTGELV